MGILAAGGAIATPDSGVAIRFAPSPDRIYKIDGDLGLENWSLGIVVAGLGDRGVERLDAEHRANGRVIHRESLSGEALDAYSSRTDRGELLLKNLYFELPRTLTADELSVVLSLSDKTMAVASIPLVRYQQKNLYRLPLEGCWHVSSGHDFGVEHRRHLSRGHFAWDFVRVDSDGRRTSGPDLAHYFAFGQPVLAPAAGTVATAVDGHADNAPGKVARHANHVVIDHGHGEFSRLAHLKRGSVRVRAGQQVRAGEVVGQVGNSGMSDSPHLHFAFERHDRGSDRESTDPIPALLSGYRVSWNQGQAEPVEEGRPRRGQTVCAEPLRPGAIADRLLEAIRLESGAPGVSAAVAVGDRALWTGTAGWTDVAARRPVTPDARFRLASVSKLFTATAALRLAEEGLLDLDADVRTYLPDWPDHGGAVLTPRLLAAHAEQADQGRLRVTQDQDLCAGELISTGALGARFREDLEPALRRFTLVRVARRGDASVFALAYPWGLARLLVTPIGDGVRVAGDVVGWPLAYEGRPQEPKG